MNKLAIFGRKQIFWPANFHKICQVPYRIRWSPLLGGQLFLSSIALYGKSIYSITAYYRKIISDIYLYEAEKAYPTNPPGVVLVSIRSSHRMQTCKMKVFVTLIFKVLTLSITCMRPFDAAWFGMMIRAQFTVTTFNDKTKCTFLWKVTCKIYFCGSHVAFRHV